MKLIAERAIFVNCIPVGNYGYHYGIEIFDELIQFRMKGDNAKGGARVSWLITVQPDHKTGDGTYVSYFFKMRRNKWVRMPEEITRALIAKAWPMWTPSFVT